LKFSLFLEVLAIFSCLDNDHVELSAKGVFLEVFIISRNFHHFLKFLKQEMSTNLKFSSFFELFTISRSFGHFSKF